MAKVVDWELENAVEPEAEYQSWRLIYRGNWTSTWISRDSFLDTFPFTILLGDGGDDTVAGRCRTLVAAQAFALAMSFAPHFDASDGEIQEFFIQG